MATTENLLSLLADVITWVLLGKHILGGKKNSPSTTDNNQDIYIIVSKNPGEDWDPLQLGNCTTTNCP